MTPIYIGYYFTIKPPQPATEILLAELGNVGFESFVETETGLEAFIQKTEWFEEILKDIYILNSEEFEISYTSKEIEQVNWNTEWEKNFEPIVVDNICHVRAPFHEKENLDYDIIIEPKMSFGTGHHETTHMMIQHLLALDIENKKTLDMGCGTGVLAILAAKKGATPIDAIDIDNWCYLNTKENIERNNCTQISVSEGDAKLLTNNKYDLIIANINRNILLNDIPTYTNCLNLNGKLLLSGFYSEDLDLIKSKCNEFGLVFESNLIRKNWIAAKFKKVN